MVEEHEAHGPDRVRVDLFAPRQAMIVLMADMPCHCSFVVLILLLLLFSSVRPQKR